MDEIGEAPAALKTEPSPEKKTQKSTQLITKKNYKKEPIPSETSNTLDHPYFLDLKEEDIPNLELSSISFTTGMTLLKQLASFEPKEDDNDQLRTEELKERIDKIQLVARMWENLPKKNEEEKPLASAIRHDYLNSLSPVFGFLEMLENPDAEDIQDYATNKVIQNWNRGSSILENWQNVINFYRGEIKYVPLEQEVENIDKIASGRITETTQDSSQVAIPTGLLPIIMTNLKSNADAVAQERGLGGGKLNWDIVVIEEEGERTEVKMQVWDKAGGFPETMFDEEDQFITGRTERKGGTGKGFQTIARLTKLVNGRMEVGNWQEDGETKGAVVSIYIPLKQGEPA